MELIAESLSIRRELGEKRSVAWSLNNLGLTALYEDQLQSARRYLEESLTLFRRLRNGSGAAWALNHLSDAVLRPGEENSARALLAESLRLFLEADDKEGMAESLRDTAAVCEMGGEVGDEHGTPLGGCRSAARKNRITFVACGTAEIRAPSRSGPSKIGEAAFAAAWEEGRALDVEHAVAYVLEE